MKNWIRNIMLAAIAMTSLHAMAFTAGHDTIYFYKTWEQVLYMEPAAMYVDPYMYPSNFEIYFEVDDDYFNDNIMNEYIAATVGDSIWLVNSTYLKQHFKGDVRNLNNYVPLFFNYKVAYAIYSASLSVKDLLMGESETTEFDFYYIDFFNRKVLRVSPTVLSELLEDYHDLQMRYEGMKDYNKRHIIEDYFYKYIDRATDDIMHPYILDLVE